MTKKRLTTATKRVTVGRASMAEVDISKMLVTWWTPWTTKRTRLMESIRRRTRKTMASRRKTVFRIWCQ